MDANTSETERTVPGVQVHFEQPAARIIEVCGGELEIAKALKCSKMSVHRWRWPVSRGGTGGLVPTRRQRPLLEWARAQGLPITPDDFLSAA